MLKVPLLPEVNSPETIVFYCGSYFTQISIVTSRRTQGHQKGQKLLGVFKIKTSDVKSVIDIYWSSIRDTAEVFLYNDPSPQLKRDIINSFKNVTEVQPKNGELIVKGLNMLLTNILDESFYFNNNPESKVMNYKHQEWASLKYPCLALNISEDPTIHIFSGPETIKKVETSLLKSMSKFISCDKDNLIKVLKEIEKKRFIKEESTDNSSGNDEAITAGYCQWIESLAKAVQSVAASENISQVYVTDCELGVTETMMSVLSGALKSGSNLDPLFTRHADMIQSIGAIINAKGFSPQSSSWTEDVIFSTGLFLFQGCPCEENLIVSQLVLDNVGSEYTICPHLDDFTNYNIDIFDMTNNEGRNYSLPLTWKLFEAGVKFTLKCDAVFKDKYEQIKPHVELWLNYVLQCPGAFGKPYSTTIIKYVTHVTRYYGLKDWIKKMKDEENSDALGCLKARLLEVDRITDENKKHAELFLGLFAGNLWDCLAPEYYESKASGNIDFYVAMDKIPERPWAIDHVDIFTEKMKEGYKKAFIFTDNNGGDFVLGVLPFARELLKSGCQVVLCSISEPMLNDITCKEIKEIMKIVGTICPILKECWENGRLKAMSSGQQDIILDLRHIPVETAKEMETADLYMFQGMARSTVSNLNVSMKRDYLQTWLAKGKDIIRSLNLKIEIRKMDGICKFQLSKSC